MLRAVSSDKNSLYSDCEFLNKTESFGADELTMMVSQLSQCAESAAQCRLRHATALTASSSSSVQFMSSLILNLLTDSWYRKGAIGSDTAATLDKTISHLVQQGLPITVVLPSFPRKVSFALKGRGRHPDLGECYSLAKLGKLMQAIGSIYRGGAKLVILSDGRKYMQASGASSACISQYQDELKVWTNLLGVQDVISIEDYEDCLRDLPASVWAEREAKYNELKIQYRDTLMPLLNLLDLSGSLRRADVALGTGGATMNSFAPLFSSLLFSVEYPFLTEYCQSQGLHARALSEYLFRIIDHEHHIKWIEDLRQNIVVKAWSATLEYLVRSHTDRALDPVSTIFPLAVRGTIHAKPGQLAIETVNRASNCLQPWHGMPLVRRSGNKTKLEIRPAISLGADVRPVTWNCYAPEREPLSWFVHQPLLYLEAELGLQEAFEKLSMSK